MLGRSPRRWFARGMRRSTSTLWACRTSRYSPSSLAHLSHLRAPAPPPVSSSRSLCPEDLRSETPVLHRFELSGGYVPHYRTSSINSFVFLWRYYQLKSRALAGKTNGDGIQSQNVRTTNLCQKKCRKSARKVRALRSDSRPKAMLL